VLIAVLGTFGLNFQITTALVAKQVFHRSATGYGLLTTSLAVGAFLGAIWATTRRNRPSRLFLIAGTCVFAVLEIACGLMPNFDTTALMLLPTGLAMLTLTTAANASIQLGVEPTMRGRVMSLYIICFMGGTPIGAPIIGWLSGAAGPRWGLIGGGLICLIVAVGLGLRIARRAGLSTAEVVERFAVTAHAA